MLLRNWGWIWQMFSLTRGPKIFSQQPGNLMMLDNFFFFLFTFCALELVETYFRNLWHAVNLINSTLNCMIYSTTMTGWIIKSLQLLYLSLTMWQHQFFCQLFVHSQVTNFDCHHLSGTEFWKKIHVYSLPLLMIRLPLSVNHIKWGAQNGYLLHLAMVFNIEMSSL